MFCQPAHASVTFPLSRSVTADPALYKTVTHGKRRRSANICGGLSASCSCCWRAPRHQTLVAREGHTQLNCNPGHTQLNHNPGRRPCLSCVLLQGAYTVPHEVCMFPFLIRATARRQPCSSGGQRTSLGFRTMLLSIRQRAPFK